MYANRVIIIKKPLQFSLKNLEGQKPEYKRKGP